MGKLSFVVAFKKHPSNGLHAGSELNVLLVVCFYGNIFIYIAEKLTKSDS
jgi:hypothetical protein